MDDTANLNRELPMSSRCSSDTASGAANHRMLCEMFNELLTSGGEPQLRYFPLMVGEFRVLYLLPGCGDDPIICSLNNETLKTPQGPFIAVSYTWGDRLPEHRITCNWRLHNLRDDGVEFVFPTAVSENFNITLNFRNLLLRLRDKKHPQRLWVDQICINQTDGDEKTAQIRLMTQIYHKASQVVIMLGDGTGDSEPTIRTIFDTIDLLGNLYYMTTNQRSTFLSALLPHNRDRRDLLINGNPISYYRKYIDLGITAVGLPNGRSSFLIASTPTFLDFLARMRWFRRSWTFQELIMARDAIVVYGSRQCVWDALYAACQLALSDKASINGGRPLDPNAGFRIAEAIVRRGYLREIRQRLQPTLHSESTEQFMEEFKKLKISPKMFDKMLDMWRLKNMLPELRPNESFEAVDKVLALTGLAHDDNLLIELPNDKRETNSPQEKSREENHRVRVLYLVVVKYWMTTPEDRFVNRFMAMELPGNPTREDIQKLVSTQPWKSWDCPLVAEVPDLSFLSHVQKSQHASLPSWVPDWSCPLDATPLYSITGFRACGDWKQAARIDDSAPERATLSVKAVRLMTITEVETDVGNVLRCRGMIPHLFDYDVGDDEIGYPTTQMSAREVFMTLFKPVDPHRGVDLPRRSLARSVKFWDHVNGVAAVGDWPSGVDVVAVLAFEQAMMQTQLRGGMAVHDGNKHSLASGRAFFLADPDVNMMGFAPRDARPGDEIYVIAGLRTPVVLRKRKEKDDGTFELVGECFVYGVMHGEALVDLPEGKMEDINLT